MQQPNDSATSRESCTHGERTFLANPHKQQNGISRYGEMEGEYPTFLNRMCKNLDAGAWALAALQLRTLYDRASYRPMNHVAGGGGKDEQWTQGRIRQSEIVAGGISNAGRGGRVIRNISASARVFNITEWGK